MSFVCIDGGRAATFLFSWPVVEQYADIGCVVYDAHTPIPAAARRSFHGMLAKALSERKFRDPPEERVETALRVVSDGAHYTLGSDLDLKLRQDVANLRVDLGKYGVYAGSAAELMFVKYFRMLWIAASPANLVTAARAVG